MFMQVVDGAWMIPLINRVLSTKMTSDKAIYIKVKILVRFSVCEAATIVLVIFTSFEPNAIVVSKTSSAANTCLLVRRFFTRGQFFLAKD